MLKAENYFEVFIIIILLSLFLYLIQGFVLALFFAATLVFIFYKPYKLLATKTHSEIVSALFIMFITISLVILPIYLVSNSLIKQTQTLVRDGTDIYNNIDIENCNTNICQKIKNNLKFIDFKIENLILKAGQFLINSYSSIFSSITHFFINLFIFLLAYYYLLIDGEKFLQYVKKITPMKDEYKEKLFQRFKNVSLTVFIDSILVAIMQGVLVGIGFWLFGFKSAIFWGTIASFFALIPIIGPGIIWVPAVIYLFSTKNYIYAILFLTYGLIIISLSDNVIRAMLIRNKIKVHSFLILISILGGLQIFGFLGIFLGPIIISLLISVFDLYKLDFK